MCVCLPAPAAAKLLKQHEDRLPGRVRLLFQPAEEGKGGARVMIQEGALEGVQAMFGMHGELVVLGWVVLQGVQAAVFGMHGCSRGRPGGSAGGVGHAWLRRPAGVQAPAGSCTPDNQLVPFVAARHMTSRETDRWSQSRC